MNPVIPTKRFNQYIVYYAKKRPDCVWCYFHNPVDGRTEYVNNTDTGNKLGYVKLQGYWKGKDKFTRVNTSNRTNMTFDNFVNSLIPNKKHIKIFDSIEELEKKVKIKL